MVKVLFLNDYDSHKKGDVVELSETDASYYRQILYPELVVAIKYEWFLSLKKGFDKHGFDILKTSGIEKLNFI